MYIHYLQHVPFEGPGYIQTWARQQGHELTGTRLFNPDTLPEPEAIDALVIMGGPMGVGDEDEYPWLRKEKEFISTCIDRKKKVLGICLGAQLIADVLGAEVVPMPEKEIGWFPLNWTQDARSHPMLNFLPARQMVLHWHGDMFYRPEGAINLATSKGCENQGFLLNDHVLGLQFHLEMTREGLSELIDNSENELFGTGGRFIQDAEAMLGDGHFEENNQPMHTLLDAFLTGDNNRQIEF